MHRKIHPLHQCLPLLLAAIIAPARAAEPREIAWLTMDFAPFYIHQGPDRGTGIADGVTRLVQREMPEWRHREERASPAEILRRLRAGDAVCSAAYIRTPAREKLMTFSLPDLVLPSNGITIRREDLQRFGGGGPVSLRRLLADPGLRMAYSLGRSYGEAIDDLLAAQKGNPRVYGRLGDDIYRSLFDLLRRGSVDYVLGYPYEALYVARSEGAGDAVVTLPLEEGPDYTLAHIVCPDSPWGRAAIAEIDRALLRLRPTEEYRGAIERWIDPDRRDEFRARYRELLLGQ